MLWALMFSAHFAYIHNTVLGKVPDKGLLAHVASIGDQSKDKTAESNTVSDPAAPFCIGAGLPPVPRKLVNRIQVGEFIDMAELLPDRMGISSTPLFSGEKDDKQPTKTKRRQVTNILEWVQCYSIYVAVLTGKHPSRIQDLMGYQSLIVEACLEYGSETWLGYDRRFRQMAAAAPGTVWAKIDPTLWNMAFTGQAKARRCKYCFSLTHQAEDCDWVPTLATAPAPTQSCPSTRPPQRQRSPQVCYSWNHNLDPNCAFPGCKYQHVCLYCAKDPQAPSKDHKALHCVRRRQYTAHPQLANARNSGSANYRYQPY